MKLESEVMSNYLQKTAINHATSINSGSRQQSKQKFNLKLQECYGKNQKQALIALSQNQKRLPSNNAGSVFSSTKPSEAIVGDYQHTNTGGESNSKKKHSRNGSVVSLGRNAGQQSKSSRIITKDDIIAANVEQMQIRESRGSTDRE